MTGLGGFLGLFPIAPPHALQVILIESGWMKVVKAIELGAGLLLLSNRFVPLGPRASSAGRRLDRPLSRILDPVFLGIVPVVVGLEGFLLWSYRGSFRGMLARDGRPGA